MARNNTQPEPHNKHGHHRLKLFTGTAKGGRHLPAGQSIMVINQNGTVSCEVDSMCNAPGACGQVCIGSACRSKWPYTTTYCTSSLAGNCSCRGDELLARVQAGCTVSQSSAGFNCIVPGGFGGSCCVCGT